MKILYIAHRIPYPPNKGDKIRTFNEIKYLSKKNEIHLITLADDPEDLKHIEALKKYCTKVHVEPLNPILAKARSLLGLLSKLPLSIPYFYSRNAQAVMDQWAAQNCYDAVICFSSPAAHYVLESSGNLMGPDTMRLMDFCDVDSQKWKQYAENSSFPFSLIYKIEQNRLLKYDRRINQAFNHSVFVSRNEVDLFQELAPEAKNIHAIENGVDSEYFSPDADFEKLQTDKTERPLLVFTGAMDYHANVDGVTWFCHEILPMIQDVHPTLQFFIVGSNPTQKVRELEKITGVHVTGFVEDIRPYYHAADACVVPLRIAAGIQNKILEAMAMEKAVVTTNIAFSGIQGETGMHALTADQPDAFAEAVLSILDSSEKRQTLESNAKTLVHQKYNWEKNINRLEQLISKKQDNIEA